jgi:hypothetical protein
VDVPAALRVQPDVHGPVVDDLDFVKVKLRVKAEVFLDDPLKVFVVKQPQPPDAPGMSGSPRPTQNCTANQCGVKKLQISENLALRGSTFYILSGYYSFGFLLRQCHLLLASNGVGVELF